MLINNLELIKIGQIVNKSSLHFDVFYFISEVCGDADSWGMNYRLAFHWAGLKI